MKRALLPVLLLGLLLPLSLRPAEAQEPSTATSPTPVVEKEEPRRLPEVLAGSAQDRGELAEIARRAESDPAREQLELDLEARKVQISARAEEVEAAIAAASRLRDLDELATAWKLDRSDLMTWQQRLTERAVSLQGDLDRIAELELPWEWALGEAQRRQAPRAVIQRIQSTLSMVASTRQRTTDQWADALRVEAQVGNSLVRVEQILDRVEEARLERETALATRGRVPLWRAADLPSEPVGEIVAGNAVRLWTSAVVFTRDRPGPLLLHLLLTALAIVTALSLRPTAIRWAAQDPSLEPTAQILGRPYAASVVAVVLLGPILYANAPRAVNYLAGFVALIALLRLVPLLFAGTLRPAFYGILGLFVAERLRDLVHGAPIAERVVLLGEMAVVFGILLWVVRSGSRLPGGPGAQRWTRALLWTWIGLATLTMGLTTAGYLELAELFGEGLLRSALAAGVLYGSYKVVSGLAAVALRAEPIQRLNVVRLHRPRINARIWAGLRLFLTAYWVVFTLQVFGLDSGFYAAIGSVFAAEFSLGEVTISVADVAYLVLTIVAAVYISRFVRAILDEDVFTRVALPRGVDHTISVTVSYAVLFLGFLLAMAAAGIDMSQFTILAGAFGVGIGFGLQNIVNNFVSGMILIFERPIQIGDTIELGELLGEVRSIGARSSTVRTFDGSEVIVPNADLISGQVTNWTLSDPHRRVHLQVGVAYGTDPEQVIELLLGVARENENVSSDPEPVALFKGFGDYSLDFELRAWTKGSDWVLLKSDLTRGVNKAIVGAGIKIPFPQRDLHLKSVDPS